MCPQNFQRRGEQLTLTTPLRVGPKTLANPKPTRVGKWESKGAKPHGCKANPWSAEVGKWGHNPRRGYSSPKTYAPIPTI